MAGMTGLEPATFRVTGGRSNQLSYTPISRTAAKQYRSYAVLTTKYAGIAICIPHY